MTTQVATSKELSSFSQTHQEATVHHPMKTYNLYYTTSRLNARLHIDSASSPCSYYVETKLITAHPSLLLRAGDSKSAPLVAAARLAYLERSILLGINNSPQTSTTTTTTTTTNSEVLSWEEMRRSSNRLVRGDYEFETSTGVSTPGKRATYFWKVTKEQFQHYFKTLYQCYDDQGSLVASMRSGGMTNLKKGAEIDVMQGVEGGLEELLLASALGIWCAEAGWSVFQGYESKSSKDKVK